MSETGVLLVCVSAFAFTLIARRLSSSIITAPMIFILLGFLLALLGIVDSKAAETSLHLVAEVTLIILLFLDASQIDLKQLKEHYIWPQRMLLLGLPLAIGIGTIVAWLFLPGWPLVALALIASLLAPTDAALGQSVVSNKLVPERVRRGLTVESGLNDGLALPMILLFASLLGEAMDSDSLNWILFGAGQLILGPIAGIIVGGIGAKAMLFANRHGWTSDVFEGIATLTLAGTAYLFASEIGGNGFISAFVAGLTLGNIIKGRCKFLFEFTESEGQLLMWASFLLLGIALLPEALSQLTPTIFGMIIVSLFFVRPVAIWLSLSGTDAAPATRLFFGWFGPRGLATALFALLILPQIGGEYAETILAIAINAVWISAVLHGVSAAPLGKVYASMVARKGDCAEKQPMAEPFSNTRIQVNPETDGEQNV